LDYAISILIAGIYGGFLAIGLDPEYRSGGLRKGKERKGKERGAPNPREGRARLLHIWRFIASELFRFPFGLRVRVRL
jgi:hypothetical protein